MASKDELVALKEAEKKRLLAAYRNEKSRDQLRKDAIDKPISGYSKLLKEARSYNPKDMRMANLTVESLKAARKKRYAGVATLKPDSASRTCQDLAVESSSFRKVSAAPAQLKTRREPIPKPEISCVCQLSNKPVASQSREELRHEVAEIDALKARLLERRAQVLEALRTRSQMPSKSVKTLERVPVNSSLARSRSLGYTDSKAKQVDSEEKKFVQESLSSILASLRKGKRGESHNSSYASSDYDDYSDDMEATAQDIQKEEARSLKIAKMEDEREERLENEQLERERRKRAKF